jgi:hypothetical protein
MNIVVSGHIIAVFISKFRTTVALTVMSLHTFCVEVAALTQ